MRNIILCRVDDRLIHGQVMSKWAQKLFFNRIIIIDEPLTKDLFMAKMMVSIAPKNIKVNIANEETALKYLLGQFNEAERLLLLAKTPQVFERLINGGLEIKELQIGGMGSNINRTSLIRNLSASEEERDSMRRMIEKGVYVYYQDIPETKPTDLKSKL
ncbi:MAG: PTS sugar transporter subunit IIB [Erysipelotrichaceae bacterium]|jgi:PTS system mannose-specific IIB component|nr:PTS sugar transporter subunit IIB [Bacillota bacterium]NLP21216.1 PTS sugar transporter subunit IIB [Erysipelotrichaceae bacterium]